MEDRIYKDTVHYTRQGDGPPVILIHGLAASATDWDTLAPELAMAGYTAYTVDLIGHGDSAKPDDPQAYNYKTLYDALEDWIESLHLRQRPVMVGHSLGGYMTLRYAYYYPDGARGLVLMNPLYSLDQLSPVLKALNHRPDLSAQAKSRAPLWMVRTFARFDPDQAKKRAAVKELSDLNNIRNFTNASAQIFHILTTLEDLTPRLSEISPRALVLWGMNDMSLSPASFPKLVNRLPNATGIAIPGCGHQPHICDPVTVNRLVKEFVGGLGE
jgi:pimeloyl-ACP methyl ester carboxylesterase